MLNNRINITKSIEIAGRELSFNVGSLATQANGSVFVRYGDTCVLVTATASEEPREGIDFLPLTVDYEERLYAVGKIPGGFIKREGKPSEKATLSSRLIDRPLRPLFPKGFHNDIHIVATVLSVDQDNRPDVTAINGASAALMVSDIPLEDPIAAVWVGKIGNDLIINPTLEQWEKSELDLVIAGTEEAVVMVEAEASEVPEEIILEAIDLAHKEIKKIVKFIKDLRQECLKEGIGKEKIEILIEPIDRDLELEVQKIAKERIAQAIEEVKTKGYKKLEREKALKEAKEEIIAKAMELRPELFEEDPHLQKRVEGIIVDIEKEIVRSMILEKKERIDNRKLDEIRPIECKVSILPRTHGSGLFVRGETQVLTVSTLGALGEEQILDGIDVEETKRYMHHYNFPPYSVGEARPIRGPGRREIGHGALAERALERVLPSEDEFPYTIRLVSEVLESNGSTSMASVCGSTLALMDAGVPIKAPVAGIAMGLIKEEDKVEILTDIQGIEDALGDMDFKVAGTKKGITALQMDIKIEGINTEILRRALEQARKARITILDKIIETIPAPRPTLSPYAPRIIKTEIDPDKIRDIIGPGGKIIKKIIDETGVKIDIEDDGKVYIAAVDQSGAQKALEMIKGLTEDVEIGKIYLGKVTRTTDFGAFVEVIPGVMGLPGKEGMVHISQLAEERVNKVEDIVKAGDEIMVKAIGFDQLGRLKLSRKEALRDTNKEAERSVKNKTRNKFKEHKKNK